MTVSREIAMKLWTDVFGNVLWAVDCFGTWIYRDDYGKTDIFRKRPGGTGKEYNYGWSVDHIMPVSKFANESEATFWNNLEPMHHSNNLAKGEKTSFILNGNNYQVVRCEICKRHGQLGYGIKSVELGKRIDWKYAKNSYYS